VGGSEVEVGVPRLDEGLEAEEHCSPVDQKMNWMKDLFSRKSNYKGLPLLRAAEAGVEGEHKIAGNGQSKYPQTIGEAVVDVSYTGPVHMDVDKRVAGDYMIDAKEPEREPLGEPSSAAAVLSVNYHKRKGEGEGKRHSRSLGS
jgi:hypothetical protein